MPGCRKDWAFRELQCLCGILGSVFLMYSVCSPYWYLNTGLWEQSKTDSSNDTKTETELGKDSEAEMVFAVLSFIMAVSGVCVCLLIMLCWPSSNNAVSTLNPGRDLYPGTLLLLVFLPTGFFFLIVWSIFIKHHQNQLTANIAGLGSSFWLGFLAWLLMLVFLPVIYVMEQCICLIKDEPNKSLLPKDQA